ncbi:MAG: hypothetical protein IT208_02455 [Chthonomonadales bacterium]|nr:hypothetical protein [Chthonomonadales bacterium]
MRSSHRWGGMLALLAAALFATSARADWVSQGYWSTGTYHWRVLPLNQTGTAVTVSAGASGATVLATTAQPGSACGACARYMTSWAWNGQGQWFQPWISLVADTLDGSADDGAMADVGYLLDPYFGIGFDTDNDGNPFSVNWEEGEFMCIYQGSGFGFSVWAAAYARNSGTAEASAFAYCTAPVP